MNLYYFLNERPTRKYSEQNHIYSLMHEMITRFEFDIKVFSLNVSNRRINTELKSIRSGTTVNTLMPLYIKRLIHKGLKVPLSSSIQENSLMHYFRPPMYKTKNRVKKIFELVTIKEILAPEFFEKKGPDIFREIKILNSADKIIVHSEYMAEEVKSRLFVDDNKVQVIPKGVYTHSTDQNISKLVLPEKFILFAGRIARYKNLGLLLKVFKDAVPHDVHLVIAGSGDHIPDQHRVKQLGYVDHTMIQSVMKSALCVVEPSFINDYPDTILEALAVETPVIASDIKAHRSVCKNDSVLYFSPLSGSSLAEALDAVIRDKKIRDTLKKEGKALADEHSWDNISMEYKELYKTL